MASNLTNKTALVTGASRGMGRAIALALAAAFLNAAFGLCLGCEMYVLIRRIWPRQQEAAPPEPEKEVAA